MASLGVSRRSIERYVEMGRLEKVHLGRAVRYRLSDVAALTRPGKPRRTKCPQEVASRAAKCGRQPHTSPAAGTMRVETGTPYVSEPGRQYELFVQPGATVPGTPVPDPALSPLMAAWKAVMDDPHVFDRQVLARLFPEKQLADPIADLEAALKRHSAAAAGARTERP